MRTALFRLMFWGLSVPIVLLAPLATLFGRRAITAYTIAWIRLHSALARALLGIVPVTQGDPCAIAGPVIYAAKHQAMYETLELSSLLGSPAVVMKQELAQIPVWGWVARRYGVIVVDREASAAALRRMLREAKVALGEGRSILIFPEGTRVAPGEQPPLRAGFAGLYQMLKLPVVPIALDSGRLLPRRGAKHAGSVTFRFGAAIPPGLPRAEIELQVHTAINALER